MNSHDDPDVLIMLRVDTGVIWEAELLFVGRNRQVDKWWFVQSNHLCTLRKVQSFFCNELFPYEVNTALHGRNALMKVLYSPLFFYSDHFQPRAALCKRSVGPCSWGRLSRFGPGPVVYIHAECFPHAVTRWGRLARGHVCASRCCLVSGFP